MKNVFTRDTSSCIRITLPRNQPRGYATFRKWKDLIWHVQLDRDRLPSSCNRWLQIIGQSGSNMPFRFFQTVCCATLCNFPATATRFDIRAEGEPRGGYIMHRGSLSKCHCFAFCLVKRSFRETNSSSWLISTD